MVEHERYQDLQRKYERMQEDYEMQLKAAEESKVQGLKEQMQLYEAKLQEKIQLLAQVSQQELIMLYKGRGTTHETSEFSHKLSFVQCQEDAQQQICDFKEIIKQVEQDEERKIHDIQIKYEKKLHTEKETNTNLKGETSIMTQKVSKLFLDVFLPVCLSCNHLPFVCFLPVHSTTVCRDRLMTGART